MRKDKTGPAKHLGMAPMPNRRAFFIATFVTTPQTKVDFDSLPSWSPNDGQSTSNSCKLGKIELSNLDRSVVLLFQRSCCLNVQNDRRKQLHQAVPAASQIEEAPMESFQML